MGSECGVEVCKMLEKKLSAEGGSIDPADILGHCIGNAMNKVYYIYIMFVCLFFCFLFVCGTSQDPRKGVWLLRITKSCFQ